VKLPRDLSGRQLALALKRFGFEIVRQEGSHIRLTSNARGQPHHITIPDHHELKVGTLRVVLRLVGNYLHMDVQDPLRALFIR
jgi:predicted RNA binding protein YcfA (HicA-like mRNA interferase family)